MNHKDYIEDLFRKRFESEESPVSEKVWNNIKSSLPPEKKDKPGYSIYALSIVASVILGICCFGIYHINHDVIEGNSVVLRNSIQYKWNSKKGDSSMLNQTFTKEQSIHQTLSANGNEFGKGDPEKDHLMNSESTNKKTEEGNLISSLADDSDRDHLHEKNKRYEKSIRKIGHDNIMFKHVAAYQIKESKNGLIEGSKGLIKISNRSPITTASDSNPTIDRKKYFGEWTSTSESFGKNITNDQREKLSDVLLFDNSQTKNNLNQQRNQFDKISSDSRFDDLNEATTENKRETEINNFKEERFIDANKCDTLITTSEELESKNEETFNKRKKTQHTHSLPVSVDLFLSPNVSYRAVSGSTDYQRDINSFEKGKLNFAGGVGINFEFTERIKFGLGVACNSYGENYIISKDKMGEKYQVNYKIYQDSLSVTHFDPVDTVKFHQNGKTKNHYKYLSLPLSVTYLVKKGNVSLGITTGASANFLLNAQTSRVEFYSDSLTRVFKESSTDPNSPFRKFALSIFACPIITYDLNDKWKIFLEPGLTYFINSVYKSDYPLRRNIYAVEVKAGLRFRFN